MENIREQFLKELQEKLIGKKLEFWTFNIFTRRNTTGIRTRIIKDIEIDGEVDVDSNSTENNYILFFRDEHIAEQMTREELIRLANDGVTDGMYLEETKCMSYWRVRDADSKDNMKNL